MVHLQPVYLAAPRLIYSCPMSVHYSVCFPDWIYGYQYIEYEKLHSIIDNSCNTILVYASLVTRKNMVVIAF